MVTTAYKVAGMTCGHCEMSIRAEVSMIAGVVKVDVSARTGSLVVTSGMPVDDLQVLAAVDQAGYEAVRV